MQKQNNLAYLFLILATIFWSGNFIVGKFATLFEIPPLTLNFYRWVMVWIILIPFTNPNLGTRNVLLYLLEE